MTIDELDEIRKKRGIIKTNMSNSSTFKTLPGWIICKPYIPKDETFVSVKESAGYSQRSEVVAVGDTFIDENHIEWKPTCKVGDIIMHEYAQNEFELSFDKYRAIKFYQVIAVLK
jgi:co-chaperonin GroES (HSP10)